MPSIVRVTSARLGMVVEKSRAPAAVVSMSGTDACLRVLTGRAGDLSGDVSGGEPGEHGGGSWGGRKEVVKKRAEWKQKYTHAATSKNADE